MLSIEDASQVILSYYKRGSHLCSRLCSYLELRLFIITHDFLSHEHFFLPCRHDLKLIFLGMIQAQRVPPTSRQVFIHGAWPSKSFVLQVLALARSGALRGRRRASPGALPQPSPVPPKSVAATTTTTPKRRKAKRKPKDGRANPTKHESSGEELTFRRFHCLATAPRLVCSTDQDTAGTA